MKKTLMELLKESYDNIKIEDDQIEGDDSILTIDDVLYGVEESELLNKLDSDDLCSELYERDELYRVIKKYSKENILNNLYLVLSPYDLIGYLEDGNYLDDYIDEIKVPKYKGLLTNPEKEQLKRILCDMFDLGYHTDTKEVLEKLSNNLI